jgi:hypothetical protein
MWKCQGAQVLGKTGFSCRFSFKKDFPAGHWWLTPVILATQEAEIRRIAAQSQSGQIVWEILSQKKIIKKKGRWNGLRCRS